MSSPYISEIRVFGFNFEPRGWAFCNGQLLAINQNQALFALIGTTYGGNGVTTFALPNLQARVPIHAGTGFALGQIGGEESHTLSAAEAPQHTHALRGSSATALTNVPANGALAESLLGQPYHDPDGQNTPLASTAIGPTGGGQPHTNMQPYLVLNVCIALVGVFPTRS